MRRPTELPAPDADAHAHSERLAALIGKAIADAGGALPFWRFMELALYAPGLGYYSAGARKFGADGDFVTAPELGGLFATCVADALAPVLREVGAESIFFELGGGSGAFAQRALERLVECDALPQRYLILEPSADLRQRQRERLHANLPAELSARVEWLDAPPHEPWQGVLFANEVLDALPTTRFVIDDGQAFEQCVGLDENGAFVWTTRPADALLAQALRHVERGLESRMPDGYRSEALPQLPFWIDAVAGTLERGAMLFIDYGYPRREYYSPERSDGTLLCHYRHRAHNDPFLWPGLQDITASVDFTALAQAGTRIGFDLSGYCAQAHFLLGNGLGELLQAAQELPEVERLRLAQEARMLTMPEAMGERFQAMGFQRGVDFEPAFAFGDLSGRL
ncbi:MAG: SAM-dependent methyltransferase [Proteobacteria bacterium]|nr:SAM-dependent methyltransferase [Pseudomonadota bacterium]